MQRLSASRPKLDKADPRLQRIAQDPRFAGRGIDSKGRAVERRIAGLEADDDDDDADDAEEEEEAEEEEDEGLDEEHGSDVEEGDEEDDEEDDEEGDVQDEAFTDSDVEMADATRRIAVVKCDWDHVRAVDIFAIFTHSLPIGGRLLDVSVYLSNFGREQLERERMGGPDLWIKPGEAEEGGKKGPSSGAKRGSSGRGGGASADAIVEADAEEEDEVQFDDDVGGAVPGDEDDDGWYDDDPTMLDEEGENGERFSSGKYRAYELRRMKYYYAIATFDSAETAAEVYNLVDGVDIESSGVVLDLRYVDDEDTFDEAPVQRCTQLPPHFKPLHAFRSAALSQSKFRISWDQDDAFRVHDIRDAFQEDNEDADLAAYLATDSDEDDADAARREQKRREIRRKYAALFDDVGGLDVDALPPEKAAGSERDGEEGATSPGASGSDGEEEESDEEGSDDDDLNRFSDIEVDEDGDSDDGESDAEDGDKEATLDFDADNKAQALARKMRLQQQLRGGTLGEQQQLKYKERRKEVRRNKRDALAENVEAEETAEERQERRAQLKATLRGALDEDDEDDAEAARRRLSGRKKRKEHAKEVKARVAKEREEKKRQRVAAQFNLTTRELQRQREQREQREAGSNDAATAGASGSGGSGVIDRRFGDRLVADPRFHIDLQRDRKLTKNTEVVKLASTVNQARVERRGVGAKAARPDAAPSAAGSGDADDAVEYFLQKKRAKK